MGSMTGSLPLRIPPSGAERPLTRDQKRFNTLIRQIEQSRATLRAWQDNMALYHRSYQDVLVPLDAKLAPLLLQWALALETAMAAGRWARGDRQFAQEMLTAVAAELLARDESNVHASGLFERHAGMDYERAQQESLQVMKEFTEAVTGLDPGELQDSRDEAELFRTAGERLREKAEAQDTRKSPARQRRETEAQRVSQSLREVYRKLASALHPDREPDPAQRSAKTALMARVNEAHGRKDLLALLELQLEIEQIDADHLANVDATRLKHYNKVLAEQSAELRQEIEEMQMQFRAEFRLELSGPLLDPLKLNKVLEAEAAHRRAMLAQLRQEVQGFGNPAWARRWIGEQRRWRNSA